jgi:hypothetical protein
MALDRLQEPVNRCEADRVAVDREPVADLEPAIQREIDEQRGSQRRLGSAIARRLRLRFGSGSAPRRRFDSRSAGRVQVLAGSGDDR